MPNFYNRDDDRDTPNRGDIRRMERENLRRETENKALEDRVEKYRRNHPSASWAECEYRSRND